MKKRVIYLYIGNDKSRLIVDYLMTHYNWNPILFHGPDVLRSWVETKYPSSIHASSMDLRQSKFDYSSVGSPAPLDSKILDDLLPYQSNYLNWLQDSTGWNFSYEERVQYYYDILKYWNTVICKLKPNLFVSYTMPHLPSDYPLYLLCKYHYQIPVLYFNPIPFFSNYYSISDSLENMSSFAESTYNSNKDLKISDVVKEYLQRLRSDHPQIPQYITDEFILFGKNSRLRWKENLKIMKKLFIGSAFDDARSSFKKNQKPWDSPESKLTHLDYFILKKQFRKVNKFLKKTYDQYTELPVDGEKYIYFAAPYQPEVMSNLIAGVYENVFLILDMITSILPEGWRIYYKEHPGIFNVGMETRVSRSKNFYKKLCSNERIKMVPCDTDTFQLIDKSEAVCTVGGTVGWESIVRKKPSLVFGSLWYQSCKSVFTIKTMEDAVEAMKKIQQGFSPDPCDVDRYAESIFRNCEGGLVSNKSLKRGTDQCEDPEEAMAKVAESFYRAYKKFYK